MNGLDYRMDDAGFYIIHTGSRKKISQQSFFDEGAAQSAIAEIVHLTDWNASADDIRAKAHEIIPRMEAIFKKFESKHTGPHEICWDADGSFHCAYGDADFPEQEARALIEKGEALAYCEDCGKGFEPKTGMFELGEYAYCENCNTW
jgi:hypothetical protein